MIIYQSAKNNFKYDLFLQATLVSCPTSKSYKLKVSIGIWSIFFSVHFQAQFGSVGQYQHAKVSIGICSIFYSVHVQAQFGTAGQYQHARYQSVFALFLLSTFSGSVRRCRSVSTCKEAAYRPRTKQRNKIDQTVSLTVEISKIVNFIN